MTARNFALVLAAGAARRFGAPKQVATFRGRPLVCGAVQSARRADLEPVVVLGAHGERVASVLDDDCRRVHASDWSEGMGASIRTGVCALPEENVDCFSVLTCDQPLIDADDLERLVEARRGNDAAAARYSGVLGVPACFDAACRKHLAELEGDRGARSLLRDGGLQVRGVSIKHAADDVDRPSDLRRLRSTENPRSEV